MRHARKINHLGRTSSHRKAMLSNMANSLIIHKRINTTVAKAKALRVYVEPIITKSKDDSTHSRRVVFSYLQDKTAVSELFREVAPKVAKRPGGYTRIIKLGQRQGDSAEMCMIELVDYNELMLQEKSTKKTTRRSRRSGTGAKKTTTPQATDTTTEAAAKPAEVKKAETKVEKDEEPKAKQEEPKSEAKPETEVKAKAEDKAPEAPKDAKPEAKEDKKDEEK